MGDQRVDGGLNGMQVGIGRAEGPHLLRQRWPGIGAHVAGIGRRPVKVNVRIISATNRNMMTMVAIFQYMIGNTDWAVPNEHNIKLIFDNK